MSFAGNEWFPSRFSFGKFKGRLYQEARQDAEVIDRIAAVQREELEQDIAGLREEAERAAEEAQELAGEEPGRFWKTSTAWAG